MDNNMQVPEGFALHTRSSAVTQPWEPIYVRAHDTGLQLGLRVAAAHCNARGFLHGGVIACLSDNAMGMNVVMAAGAVGALTVTLNIDYVQAAALGAWLQIEPRVIRAQGKLGFVDALIKADEQTIARANATFRILT
jgi:uncharacterized protein (TIGR00369 family)